MKQNIETAIIETTIGDLIEALTRVSLEAGKSEEEGFRIASRALEEILTQSGRSVELVTQGMQ